MVRLGAVDYLNARPLVYGLEMRTDIFSLRFDVPSKCAALLHEGSIDVGMIPSIEYLRGREPYLIVPGSGIISNGPVASVALFSTKPVTQIRSVAADTSSRTSNGLLRVLCYEAFGVDPSFVPMPPKIDEMLTACDCGVADRRSSSLPRSSVERIAESRSRSGVDNADRVAVRVGVLGRTPGCAVGGCDSRSHRGSRCRRRGVRRHCGRLLRPRPRRPWPRVFEGQYQVHARGAGSGGPHALLRAGGGA